MCLFLQKYATHFLKMMNYDLLGAYVCRNKHFCPPKLWCYYDLPLAKAASETQNLRFYQLVFQRDAETNQTKKDFQWMNKNEKKRNEGFLKGTNENKTRKQYGFWGNVLRFLDVLFYVVAGGGEGGLAPLQSPLLGFFLLSFLIPGQPKQKPNKHWFSAGKKLCFWPGFGFATQLRNKTPKLRNKNEIIRGEGVGSWKTTRESKENCKREKRRHSEKRCKTVEKKNKEREKIERREKNRETRDERGNAGREKKQKYHLKTPGRSQIIYHHISCTNYVELWSTKILYFCRRNEWVDHNST